MLLLLVVVADSRSHRLHDPRRLVGSGLLGRFVGSGSIALSLGNSPFQLGEYVCELFAWTTPRSTLPTSRPLSISSASTSASALASARTSACLAPGCIP